MGLGGISIWQLLIILAIVVLLFGTKRLRTLGTDLGGAIKGFRKSMDSDANSDAAKEESAKEKDSTQQKTAEPDENK